MKLAVVEEREARERLLFRLADRQSDPAREFGGLLASLQTNIFEGTKGGDTP